MSETKETLLEGLAAASRLGHWIELVWPALEEVSASELEAVPTELPPPAGEEWLAAHRTLRGFSGADAPAIRHLLRRLSSGNGATPSGLRERLRQYLEPFDHPGRLGEVTLALQYLLEAYPIEQASRGDRSKLRAAVAERVRRRRLEEDFHRLVGAAAAGIGLLYRPVAYYESRIDQGEFAFVRQQVSPISLTRRVGFAATTDPAVIVRLGRPFFFQLESDVYYSGHAHIARD